MKILLLTDYYPPDKVGGVGIIAEDLKTAYEDLGHEVFVVTTGRKRPTDVRHNIYRSSTNMIHGILLNNLHVLRLIRREDISVIHMHHTSSTLFLQARALYRSFPFVLNSLQVSYLSEAREISRFSVGERVFQPQLREYVEKFLTSPIHIVLDWIGYKLSDHVTVVSEQNREEIVSSYGRTRRGAEPTVVPNGARRASSPPETSSGFRDRDLEERLLGKTVLTYVGVFRTRKRVQNLLLSLREIVTEFPEAVLLLVGGGRGYRERLHSLGRELGIEDHVVFVGPVPHDRVGYYLELTDVFCLVSSYEGMPMALLEAMNAGKAVLATDCYGMRHLLSEGDSDGEAGVLVPVDDIVATTDALKALIANPDRRDVLGAAAQKRVRDRFSWREIAQRYLRLADAFPSRTS